MHDFLCVGTAFLCIDSCFFANGMEGAKDCKYHTKSWYIKLFEYEIRKMYANGDKVKGKRTLARTVFVFISQLICTLILFQSKISRFGERLALFMICILAEVTMLIFLMF